MASNDLAKLVVRLEAQTSQYQSELEKAKRQLGKFDSDVSKLASKIGKSIGLAVAGAATGLAVMVKNSIDAADELGNLSEKVGVSTEALSKLNYAAKLNDVTAEQLQQGLIKLSKSAVEAADGTGASASAFKALGVELKNSDGTLKSTDKLFTDLAEAFSGFADGPEKAAAAMAIFGKSGAELIPVLNAGREGIKTAGDELERFGGVVTAEASARADEFNKNLDRLKAASGGFANQIAGQLTPALVTFSDKLVALTANSEATAKAADGIKVVFRGLVGIATIVSNAFQVVGDQIGATAAVINAVAHGDFSGAMAIIKDRADDLKTDWNDVLHAFDESKPIIKATGETAVTATTNAAQATLNYSGALAETKLKTQEVKDLTDAWALSLMAAAEIQAEVEAMGEEKKDTESRQNDIGLDAADNIQAEVEAMAKAEDEKTQIVQDEERARQAIRENATYAGINALGDLAYAAEGMGKKGFKAFKAFSIAQAIVATYTSAVEGYKAMIGIPFVGPALAVGAAAAAIAAGMSNVARIRSSEPSGYATGGTVYGGEQLIKVNEAGTETVMNAKATSMYGAELEAMNDGRWAHAPMPEMDAPQIVVQNNVPGVSFKLRGNVLTSEMTDDLARLLDTMLAKGVSTNRSELGNAISSKYGVQASQVR